MIEIPILNDGEFSLIRAEKNTGKVLNNDNSRYNSSGNDYYMIFPNITELELYIANSMRIYPERFDYSIYDSAGTFLRIIK